MCGQVEAGFPADFVGRGSPPPSLGPRALGRWLWFGWPRLAAAGLGKLWPRAAAGAGLPGCFGRPLRPAPLWWGLEPVSLGLSVVGHTRLFLGRGGGGVSGEGKPNM